MSIEYGPGEERVEQVVRRERVATYLREVGNENHRDGELLNQPAIATKSAPDAGDHHMAAVDGQTSGDEIPEGFRD